MSALRSMAVCLALASFTLAVASVASADDGLAPWIVNPPLQRSVHHTRVVCDTDNRLCYYQGDYGIPGQITLGDIKQYCSQRQEAGLTWRAPTVAELKPIFPNGYYQDTANHDFWGWFSAPGEPGYIIPTIDGWDEGGSPSGNGHLFVFNIFKLEVHYGFRSAIHVEQINTNGSSMDEAILTDNWGNKFPFYVLCVTEMP